MSSRAQTPQRYAEQWARRFHLRDEDLLVMTELFPDFDDTFTDLTLEDMCTAVLREPAGTASVQFVLETYKARGEFAAARRLVDILMGQDVQERREIDRLHEVATNQLDRQLTAVAAKVRELSKLSVNDAEVEAMSKAVEESRDRLRRGRVGKVKQTLTDIENRVGDHVQKTEIRLRQRIKKLRDKAVAVSGYDVRSQVENVLELSLEWLAQRELRLAENACERATFVLEGGDFGGKADSRPVRRVGEFPLEAADLLEILRNDSLESHSQVHDWNTFMRVWEISKLRSGTSRNVRDAVEALIDAQREENLKLGVDGPWPKFLRSFLGCLVSAPSLGGFQQLRGNLGAFATFAGNLSVPGSFVDAKPELWRSEPLAVICKDPRQSGALIQELTLKGVLKKGRLVLVFSGAKVAKQHRDEMRAAFKNLDVLAVLIDQQAILRVLCAGEAQERTDRLVATLARQLPEATINPFRSDNAVSDGMFFGREKEIRDLLDSQESMAVFGGRKLGKTSLLKRVERTAEQENPKRVAIWLDIRNCTSDEDVQQQILAELKTPKDFRKAWKGKFNTLDPNSPHTFVDQIKQLTADFPDYQFLFLLDEADGFMHRLATGAQENFGWALRSLCGADSRVRFIFAGFQDVYRACREALEGPWYNFIKLLELQVLEEGDAEYLITRSMGLLGLYFETPALVLRVIDYTGCHASLVQDYCHRLFEQVSGDVEPGVFGTIRSNHVEDVFNDPEFKTNLDGIIQVNVFGESRVKRSLKLILYAWVYRLVAPSRTEEAHEMLSARGLYEFLEEEFGAETISSAITFDQLDSYLHDLLALGVLGRSRNGQKYYLRNRHFARMMQMDRGSKRIKDEINQLIQRVSNDSGERQRRLWERSEDTFMRDFSPFTREAEQVWRTTSASTILIMGGPGMGKTWALRWIAAQVRKRESRLGTKASAHEFVKTIDLSGCVTPTDALSKLADGFGATGANWNQIHPKIKEWAKGATKERPAYLLLDNADSLGDPDFLLDPPVDDGFLEQVQQLSIECGDALKFVLSGSAPLARVWAEWSEFLRGMAVGISLRRFTMAEVSDWVDGNRLIMDQVEKLYHLTGGHPYVLRTFYQFLACSGKERTVRTSDLTKFQTALTSPGAVRNDLENRLIKSSDSRLTAILNAIREVCTYGADNIVDVMVVELARESKRSALPSPTDWVLEARVLSLLDDIEPFGKADTIGRLRPTFSWEKGGAA